jgi:hypothetical protein
MKFDWHRLFRGPWIQNERTDWHWDELLNAALDQFPPERLSNARAKVGPLTVWAANWPYAFGSPEGLQKSDCLPSVKTRHRLRDILHKQDMAKIMAATEIEQ